MDRTAGRISTVLGAAIACMIAASGCGQRGSLGGAVGPEVGPAADYSHNLLTGRVSLITLEGQRLALKGGVFVWVKETDQTCVTTDDGKWLFFGLAPGTYDLTLWKKGFGTTRRPRFVFPGDTQAVKIFISQVPDFSVDELLDTLVEGTMVLKGRITGHLPYACNVRFFADTSMPVDADRFASTFVRSVGPSDGATLAFSVPMDAETREAAGLTAGSTFYITAYTDGAWPQSYVDPGTGKLVFTTLGPAASNTVTVVFP